MIYVFHLFSLYSCSALLSSCMQMDSDSTFGVFVFFSRLASLTSLMKLLVRVLAFFTCAITLSNTSFATFTCFYPKRSYKN